ncbi:hypothetical protein QR680_017571 [Steinernema hermaphroditum]|uniref:Uncharacterized protein n=1 Tax=Steinernema hermaphroditum TaxID=289476 RepID=A0AA39HG21_9BILA|nr:hypothetical protein QR680_017571 [Steinernema hermaphroditum]
MDDETMGDMDPSIDGDPSTMMTSSSESAFDCDSISSTGSCSSTSESPAPSSSGTFVNPNDVGVTSSTSSGPSSSCSQTQSDLICSPIPRKNSLTLFRSRNDLDDDFEMDSDGEGNIPQHQLKRRILQPSSQRRRYSEIAAGTSGASSSFSPQHNLQPPLHPPNSPVSQNNASALQPSTSGSASPQSASATASPSVYRILPRGRAANLRRESSCSMVLENELAHEKLVKTSQQVSIGFGEFSLDDDVAEERKRTRSWTEPISIFTNAFLTHSSSPSPTQKVDNQKQCYSPSTQQIVRSNIPYSPSPSPTPSPTRSRLMRSLSPMAARQLTKRRYTGSNLAPSSSFMQNGAPSDSDSESVASSNGFGPVPFKRVCLSPQVDRTSCSTPLRGATPICGEDAGGTPSDSDTASERQMAEEPPGPNQPPS